MGPGSRRLGAAIVLAAVVIGLALLSLAMHRYPGGTELDRHCVGHSFWFNLLCDLMGDRALNGTLNAGRDFARAAMAVFSVGLGAFLKTDPARRVSRAPGDRGDDPHRGRHFGRGTLGRPGGIGSVACRRRVHRRRPRRARSHDGPRRHRPLRPRHKLLLGAAIGSIAAATIDSILYAHRVMNAYRSCPPALPVFQRLTLLFALAWAATTALRALRPSRERQDESL